MRHQNLILVSVLLISCAVIAPAVAAFRVEPDLVTFDIASGEKTANLEVENIGEGPIAVQLAVLERELDINGKLNSASHKVNKDFIIYPSEIIVYPGKKASVQLAYKPKEKVVADKMYTLYSTEVLIPVAEEEEVVDGVSLGLPTVISYYGTIFLDTGKKGKLTFVSSKEIGNDEVELIVENSSAGRVITKNLAVKTSTDLIKGFSGVKNSIMPGQRRRLTFKYRRPLTAGEVKFIYDASD